MASEQLAADENALDLVRAFVDPSDPRIPKEPLGGPRRAIWRKTASVSNQALLFTQLVAEPQRSIDWRMHAASLPGLEQYVSSGEPSRQNPRESGFFWSKAQQCSSS